MRLLPFLALDSMLMRPTVSEVDPQDFGEAVRFMREAHGWSGQFLGSKIFVDQSGISRLERGEMSPSLDQGRLLAKALGVTLDALVDVDVPTLRAAANRARGLVGYENALDRAARAVARWLIVRAETHAAPDTPADVLVLGALEAMRIEDERIAQSESKGMTGQPRRVPFNVDEFGLDAPPRSHPAEMDGWRTELDRAWSTEDREEPSIDPSDPDNPTQWAERF